MIKIIGFNLNEFDIDINLEQERYCIKDKITGVEYHSRGVCEKDLLDRLKRTFNQIREYRKWWYMIEMKEQNK